MRRFLPRTRMGAFTTILIGLWLLKVLVLGPGARQLLSPGQRFSVDLLTFLLILPAAYYSWKLFALVRKKLLWKIRRRLILAHIFIGAIPSVLLLIILSASFLLFYYQLSYYLISNQIGIHLGQLHAFSLSLRSHLDRTFGGSAADPARLKVLFDREVEYLLGVYPSAAVILRYEDTARGLVTVLASHNVHRQLLTDYQVPRWSNNREFSGLVSEDFQPQIYRDSDSNRAGGGRGRVYLRSLVWSDTHPETPFTVEVSVPLNRYLLERLKAALGQELLLADRVPVSSLSVMLQTTDLLRDNILSATFDLEGGLPQASRSVWSIMLYPISWNAGIESAGENSQVLFVELSTSRLFQNVFRSDTNVSKTILGVLQIVVGFFLLVEVISLVIGVVLTRSITAAVYNLDRGTQFVKRGDFSHRIVVRSDDQLGSLAESFNQMTDYVQSLVKERVQKERLERELEIAKEVQEQLFPHKAPKLERMELTGLCLPARVVSGDYYDFLQFNSYRMGLALGDICGKGISAALLMANLQATLRSNVTNYFRESCQDSERADSPGSVALVVRRINEQIYHHTSANKFASFFYAVYDDQRQVFTYCNAGHNPPLYFDSRGYHRLSTGGTVVGIFPDADFEEETIGLSPGDLFLAYTDGILESVNEYGEEFGEHRLIELVENNRHASAERIQALVVEQVLQWAFEEERDDDMTLIVARVG